MSRRQAALCLALVIPAACASPAFARSVSASFEVPVPGAEQVSVGFDGGLGTIRVQTAAGSAYQAADYTAPADISGRHFEVDLGKYGAVNVRFHPQDVVPGSEPSRCRTKFRSGVFVGTTTYAGVPGAAAVTRIGLARGRMLTARRGCSVHIGLRDRRASRLAARVGHQTTLFAVTRQSAGLPVTLFSAESPRSGASPSLLAVQFAREGSVKLTRTTFAQSPADIFTYDDELNEASVAGSGPFSGGGQYDASAATRSWAGDLAVELLGGDLVPLTGPQFKARLLRTVPDKLAQLAR